MSEINTGGSIQGLNLREYFAAMAMQGFLSNEMYSSESDNYIAKNAVSVADALLAELAKGKTDA